jgi:hypothetical protein
MAASVHQRLLDKARKQHRPFNEMLQYLAMERLLYRLSCSPFAADFILKGALMLSVWHIAGSRPTMDIDLLGRTSNDHDHVADIIRNLCVQAVDEDDGFVFDPDSVIVSKITEDATYEGSRIRFQGHLGNARLDLQIDIGFGDDVIPRPQDIELPSILGFPAPKLRGYTKESSIAEKFSAMLELRELNSRVKDFFDIWILSRQCDFDGTILRMAIESVLSKRSLTLTLPPIAFQDTFASAPIKDSQWKGFLRKNKLTSVPQQFPDVTSAVAEFLSPVIDSIANGHLFACSWKAPGPWR